MAVKRLAQARVATSLRFTPEVMSLLRQHAHIRNVSVQKFVSDVMQGYLCYITDFTNPLFSYELLGFPAIDPPESNIPGYIRSLGFSEPSNEGPTNIPAPPMPSNHHDSTVYSEQDAEFLNYSDQKAG